MGVPARPLPTANGTVERILDVAQTWVQANQFSLQHGDPEFFSVGLNALFRWLGDQREVLRLVHWARLEERGLVEAGVLRRDTDVDGLMLFIDALKGFWNGRMGIERWCEASNEAWRRSSRVRAHLPPRTGSCLLRARPSGEGRGTGLAATRTARTQTIGPHVPMKIDMDGIDANLEPQSEFASR